MKSLKRVLSMIIPIIALGNASYAVESLGIELTDTTKYLGIAIAVAVIFLIIFIGYKTDKKSEEKIEESTISYDDKFPYEEESVNPSYFTEEENIETKELNEDTEYEEESLFNTANNYVEENEEDNFLQDETTIEPNNEIEKDEILFETKEFENSNYEINEEENDFESANNEVEEDDLLFEEKEEIADNNEIEEDNFSFETKQDEFETQEDASVLPILNQGIENDTVEKKRFTRKKESKNEEIGGFEDTSNISKNDNLLDYEEEYEIFETEDEYDEDDDDDDVPTFDELLKKSEEESGEKIETFDFMTEMEENLKKNQAKRLEKKATKTEKTKTSENTNKKTTTKKTSTKKKKIDEE